MTNDKWTPEPEWEESGSFQIDSGGELVAAFYLPRIKPGNPDHTETGREQQTRRRDRAIADHNACRLLRNPSVVPELVEFVRFIDKRKATTEMGRVIKREARALLARMDGEGK